MNRIVVISVLLLLALFSACTKKKSEQQGEKKEAQLHSAVELTGDHFQKGKNVSEIKMVSLSSGKSFDFSAYKGKKIIVDFWSSWCVPCIEMFPDLNRLKKEYEDEKGLIKVVSVSVDPMPGKIKEIMKEKGVLFEVLQAPESLQNAGLLLPYTAVVDEKGIITHVTNGKHSFDELKQIAGLK